MKLADRFDVWVRTGPFRPLDLGIYRIFYACSMLLSISRIRWLTDYPDSMYKAPLGPFRLLSGFPSHSTLIALELLTALALVLVGVGIWTKWVSITAGILLIITNGLAYSLGKIDHNILLILAPIVLAFANWGDRLSLDAMLSRRRASSTPQWPLRYLALLVGLAFFEAAAVKSGTGWLSPSSQAVRGHFFDNYITNGRSSLLADWALNFNFPPAWEVLDWMTVILEFSVLLSVPSWRAFRIVLSFLTLFHLGVFLIMNIAFTANLIVYAAFVPWGYFVTRGAFGRKIQRWVTKVELQTITLRGAALVLVVGLVLGVGMWYVGNTGAVTNVKATVYVYAGAAVGIGYLISQIAYGARRFNRSRRDGGDRALSVAD